MHSTRGTERRCWQAIPREGAAALFGGAGDDELSGGDDNPVWLDGGAGNDAIQGGAADEVIYGGEHGASGGDAPGDDIIDGGGGDDQISGGYGADTLSGGDGDDVIDHLGRLEQEVAWERHRFDWHIDNEADALSGGAGNDMLIMDRADTAEGGEGNDTFWVYFDAGSGSGAAEITDFRYLLGLFRCVEWQWRCRDHRFHSGRGFSAHQPEPRYCEKRSRDFGWPL
ncbi:MAG: hypothetical protein P8X76_08105 [Maritimibacter sp.]